MGVDTSQAIHIKLWPNQKLACSLGKASLRSEIYCKEDLFTFSDIFPAFSISYGLLSWWILDLTQSYTFLVLGSEYNRIKVAKCHKNTRLFSLDA